MKTGYLVADAMTKSPIMVNHNTTILETAKIMKNEKVGSVVVGDKGKVKGIVSEQDFLYKVIAGKITPDQVISTIMTKEIETITPNEDITSAMIKMSVKGVRRLPVVNNNEVVGLITSKDILKIEPELFELVIDKIEIREQESKPIKKNSDYEGICNLCGNYSSYMFEQDDVYVCSSCRES